jgi:2-dehydro-3-deoxyphosphooctonate aldolase (KDO 8-P synthase)
VIFDATHSVQLPGGRTDGTGGDGRWAPYLARAACAVGIDGLFLEVHPNPPASKSDKDNVLPLSSLPTVWRHCRAISDLVARPPHP